VSGGNARRITFPSFDGVMPRSLDRIAFSMAPMAVLSKGCTMRVRGSGTDIEASCCSGTGAP
jgi:hypothetical protein